MSFPLPAENAEERIAKLLEHWSKIEESIKSAELISHTVVIPAINELRYAGRQLLWAIIEVRKGTDNEPDRLEKAIVNAEQYLINADHDVIDAVTLFFGQRIDELTFKYGRAAISSKYPAFDKLCELKNACYSKIEHSRRDSTKRRSIYAEMKQDYLPHLISLHSALIEADVIMTMEATRQSQRIMSLKNARRVYRTLSIISTASLFSVLIYCFVVFKLVR